jgi:hypothetical protein
MLEFREADRFILIALERYRRRFESGLVHVEFARIMDLGGRSASPHAAAITRMVKLGLAERRQRTDTGTSAPFRSRASFEYKITPAGLALLATGGDKSEDRGERTAGSQN